MSFAGATRGPLRIAPIFKARSWGGSELRALAHPDAVVPAAPIGEAWLLCDLAQSDGADRTLIAEGFHSGKSLHDLIADPSTRGDLLGRAPPSPGNTFPLMLKLLDARENLSVQVHPRRWATRDAADPKDEAWLILDSSPGARIYRGFKPGTTSAQVVERARSGALVELLEAHEVTVGDAVFLESGTCHALGAGLLVAEIQTPSDTTYRVWDWGRRDTTRPLHLDDALAAMRLPADSHCEPIRRVELHDAVPAGLVRVDPVSSCPAFDGEVWTLGADAEATMTCRGVPRVVTVVAGAASASGLSSVVRFGGTFVQWADGDAVRITTERGARLLVAQPGDSVAGADSSVGRRIS